MSNARPFTKYTEQHVLNGGYDEEFDLQAVQQLGYDGQNMVRQRADAAAIRYDPAGYIGYAAAGTLPSEAKWQIIQLDTSSGVVMTYANGSANYDQIWDDRASLAYS
jgi:hypothetical protein